jgi:sec-independent protein translocase protein TatB
MFDIGWGELVVIGVVALIAIGPKELPGVLRTAGQWMGKIRRMASEFQGQFQDAMREAELADVKKHVDDIKSAASDFTSYDPLADKRTEPAEPAAVTSEPAGEPAAAEAAPAALEPSPVAAVESAIPLPDIPAPVTDADLAPAEEGAPKKQVGGGA